MKRKILLGIQKFLGLCGKIYLKKSRALVIGITGSVGKTSCRIIVSQTIRQLIKDKKVYTSSKNFNSELGMVFSIFEIENYSPGIFNLLLISIKIIGKTIFLKGNYDILLLEYGIDKPGDMDFLLNIVIPDISIFTKLDSIHLENFKKSRGIREEEKKSLGIKAIGEEKFKLMKMTKKLVYLNFKDEYCRNNYYGIHGNKKLYNNKELKASNYKMKINNKENDNIIKNNNIRTNKSEHCESSYNSNIIAGKIRSSFDFDKYKISTNILGEENINYIVVGIDILKDLSKNGINLDMPSEYINLNYSLQPGRFSLFEGINNSILLDSSYNAGPESMKKMIENTIKLRNDIFPDYKLGFILGDMRELGQETEKAHKKLRKILDKLDEKYLIYTVGQEMKKYLNINNSFISSKEAGLSLNTFLSKFKDKYIILFKGSQNTIFVEEALKQVLKNKTDIKKLVRQSNYWIKKKKII